MKKALFKLFAILLVFGMTNACSDNVVTEEAINEMNLKSVSIEKESYIVVIQDSELNQELSEIKEYKRKQIAVQTTSEKILKRTGVIDGELGFVYGTAIKGFSVKMPPGQLRKLEKDPSVKYIEKDKIISLIHPYAPPGKVTTEAAQVTPWGITRVKGGSSYTGNHVVWIIDTGVDFDHEDLNVDASRGATFITTVSSPDDDNGHGSHVAGTIAAIDNGVGVIGVAAGATVIPVKVLDSKGSGTTTGVVAGINFVAANGEAGDVANMSLGGGVSTTLDAAVANAAASGIKFALAAGNESDDANNHSPARVNGTNIYTISAMDSNDKFAYFSNYGNPPIDYCEPGVSIYSTYKNGGYATLSGTSMATPHMAGILLLNADNSLSTDGNVLNDPDGNNDPIAIVGDGGSTPINYPPTAKFSTTVDGLSVSFIDESTDDGSIEFWSWDFGDGNFSTLQNPVHIYNSEGTYNVSLTVSDGTQADSTTKDITLSTSPISGIELTASMRKVRGIRYIDLTWSGANGNTVIIKVNETNYNEITNDGSETLNMARSSGTFTFQICETDGSTYSNIVTLTM